MEPTKQGAADDLDAALQATGLFDRSPLRRLPQFPAPAYGMQPFPPQPTPRGHVRTGTPVVRRPPLNLNPAPPPREMFVPTPSPHALPPPPYQPHQVAWQYWPQPPPQRYREDEGSLGAGYVSAVGSCFPSSVYGPHLGAPSSPRFSASQGQVFASNHPGSAIALSAWHDGASQPTLEESTEDLVRQLEEGSEAARLMALAWVKREVYRVMESRKGHVVFLALLRTCDGRFDELKDIVEAAATSNDKGLVMMVMEQSHGDVALKELIRVVAPYPQLCLPLIASLLRERLMERSTGALWLHHFFTTMPYKYSRTIIGFAVMTFDVLCLSEFGLKCLGECFVNARNCELDVLEETILSHISLIAKRDFRFHFLQRIFECGSKHFKERIVERVVDHLMSLSMHENGRFVVEECFLRMGPLTLLQRMLTVFMGLGDDHLAELVQDRYGCYVVHRLLKAGKNHFPEQTTTLERQIEKLPAAVLEKMHTWRWILVL